MSYRSIILSDYPIGYYPLDDLTTVDIANYTSLESSYATYQAILDDPLLASYANIYGDVAYDHSGCENDSVYAVDPETNILPIVVGNSRATKITNENSIQYSFTKDYTATTTTSQFGTLTSSDNDFTLEAWIYPKFTTSNETPILADTTEDVGLFYDKGNITFKVDTQELTYTVPNINKVLHVVATYTPTEIAIYIDGNLCAVKALNNFTFTNTTVNLNTGPTLNASDYFLINSVGVYRYALSSIQILSHYNSAKGLPPVQIAAPNSGEMFELFTQNYLYSYPANKSWEQVLNADLFYNSSDNSISLIQSETSTSGTAVIEDAFNIPAGFDLDSSRIIWDGENGVSVEVSTDDITYVQCINGEAIPGYTINDFSTAKVVFVKITLSSTDASKYIPKLYSLAFSFYKDQEISSNNSAATLTTLYPGVTIGYNKSPILFRDSKNGIKNIAGSGFYLNTDSSIKTLEFFYTPYALTVSGLMSTVSSGSYAASNYSWNGGGTISKTNISAIYVNGINKTAETNVSDIFKLGQIHHVIIVFTNAVSGQIKFAHSSSGSVSGLFQNLSLYPDQFTTLQAAENYQLYIYGSISTVADNNSVSMTMTENDYFVYDNVWTVREEV